MGGPTPAPTASATPGADAKSDAKATAISSGAPKTDSSGPAASVAPTPVVNPAAIAPKNRLDTGSTLTTNQSLVSGNGKFRLTLQENGNLVLFEQNTQIWETKSASNPPANKAYLNDAGTLFVTCDRKVEWKSNNVVRIRELSAFLSLQNDGNLVIGSDDRTIWASRTARQPKNAPKSVNSLSPGGFLVPDQWLIAPNGKAWLVPHADGTVSMYDADGVRGHLVSTAQKPEQGPPRFTLAADGSFRVLSEGNEVTHEVHRVTDPSRDPRQGIPKTPVLSFNTETGQLGVYSNGLPVWRMMTRKPFGSPGDRLSAGECIGTGHFLISPNGAYTMGLNNGAELFLNGPQTSWETQHKKQTQREYLFLGYDDNLMIDDVQPVWSTRTRNKGNTGSAVLLVRDSGDAVLMSDNNIIWSTNASLVNKQTPLNLVALASGADRLRRGQFLPSGDHKMLSKNGKFCATISPDGDLVIGRYNGDTKWPEWWIWSTAQRKKSTQLVLFWNSRMDLSDKDFGNAAWSVGGYQDVLDVEAVLENNGQLVIRTVPKANSTPTDLFASRSAFPALDQKTDRLARFKWLHVDESLISKNGRYTLKFTKNANFSLEDKQEKRTMYYWTCCGHHEDAEYLYFGSGGSVLKILSREGKLLWNVPFDYTNRGDNIPGSFTINDDGSFAGTFDNPKLLLWNSKYLLRGITSTVGDTAYMNSRLPVNQSLVSPNGKYFLSVQDDGNIVLYQRDSNEDFERNIPIWNFMAEKDVASIGVVFVPVDQLILRVYMRSGKTMDAATGRRNDQENPGGSTKPYISVGDNGELTMGMMFEENDFDWVWWTAKKRRQ